MSLYHGILYGMMKEASAVTNVLKRSTALLPAPAKGLVMAGTGALAPKKTMAKITKKLFDKGTPIPKNKAQAKAMIKELKMSPEKRKALEKAKLEEISKDKFRMGVGRGSLIGVGLTGAGISSLPYYAAYRYGRKKEKEEGKKKKKNNA